MTALRGQAPVGGPVVALRYGAAILLPALALAAELLIYSRVGAEPSPFLLVYPAVFLIVWFAGLGPGIVATIVGALGAWYLFIAPYHSLAVPHVPDLLKLGVFVLMGGLFSGMLPSSRKRAEAALRRQALRNEMLLRSANDGIHVLDSNGNVLEANDVFCSMLGYSHAEALELNVAQWDARWSPEELMSEVIPRVLQGRQVFETRHRRRDGQIIDVEVSAAGVEIEGERVLFAASRDISERKRLAELLRLREQKLENILLSAPVGIAVLVDREFTVVNDRICETLGYSRQELVGMSSRALYLSDVAYEQTGKMFYEDKGRFTAAETQFRRKDGRIIDVLISMTAMQRDKPRAGATFMLLDITERKRAERELIRAAAELTEANHLKDIFTDVLRHDIMTPLTAIMLSLELLEGMESDPNKTELLKRARQSAKNVVEMTDSAAKLAAVTAGPVIGIVAGDPTEALRSVLPDLEHKLAEKNMTLTNHSGGGFSALFSPLMKDVFANLLSNAIKYSPRGTGIDLGVEDRGESWVLHVKDQGEGIADKYKQTIFNRFERLGKEGVKGSGLGLTITKQIVSLHGGDIWVEDNPTGGSVFFVRIPKSPPQA